MNTDRHAYFWFVTGSQHLYGNEALEEVNAHARQMVEALNGSPDIFYEINYRPVVTTPGEIRSVCAEASVDPSCAGILTWMHTFSPSKMWIAGLQELRKPLLHLHTQFNRDIPWDEIDMDFMNLNQAAHGDREHGFIGTRLGLGRKVVVGHWQDARTQRRIGAWTRMAAAAVASRELRVARFGDNMRQVAVTEGDKVQAQIDFGWTIDGYGIGDLVERMRAIPDAEVKRLLDEYGERYEIAEHTRSTRWEAIAEQARIELGMRAFLEEGGYTAFTTTFEDLHGMKQLPGLAVQRLMEQGYGFGGEGDWKTAALTRVVKLMTGNRRTSFMEDYTYHLEPGNELILGSHMLEVCPTVAASRPRLEAHPLGIGGKADPVRMIFDGVDGPAVNASLVDMGGRFRLIVNEVEAVRCTEAMPKLPVARVLWKPQPSLAESAEAWIYAGGAHHTVLSFEATTDQLRDWAELTGVECIVIDADTRIPALRNELRWNDLAYRLR
ncbi:L-arabinose isomerase [Paenibacillus sp. IB182496]|uniref:L-arabinose isomerase n=1 Tax=Paenibacillus sabuli TaxID=2772509 RepID=A0A927GTR2_9BACL|nr:L-arabinose isomerase [Paenibacillus sabuli]MBD2846962.1 L-arabinose isomerase [Paenibacillus sabuli]